MTDRPSTPHHRHRAGLTAAALVVGCAWLVTQAGPVHAGDGSSGYQGAFSSTAPSGYAPAPAGHPQATTVRYSFTVTNTALVPAGFTANLYTQRVTVVRGIDVSSGDPAFSERDVLTGPTSGEAAVLVGPVPGSGAIFVPGETDAVDMTVTTGGCGYLIIWAGSSADRSSGTVLNDGATRVTGCSVATASPPPPPSPSPSPSPDAGPGTTPVPSAEPAARPHAAAERPSPTPSPTPSPGPSSSPSASATSSQSPGAVGFGPAVPQHPLTGGVPGGGVDQSNPFPIHTGSLQSGISAQRAIVLGAVVTAGIVLSLLLWLLAVRRSSRRARHRRKGGGPPTPGFRVTHRG